MLASYQLPEKIKHMHSAPIQTDNLTHTHLIPILILVPIPILFSGEDTIEGDRSYLADWQAAEKKEHTKAQDF